MKITFHCIAICNLLIIRTSFKKRSYFMQFILCEIKIIASQPIPQGFTDTTWSIIDLHRVEECIKTNFSGLINALLELKPQMNNEVH